MLIVVTFVIHHCNQQQITIWISPRFCFFFFFYLRSQISTESLKQISAINEETVKYIVWCNDATASFCSNSLLDLSVNRLHYDHDLYSWWFEMEWIKCNGEIERRATSYKRQAIMKKKKRKKKHLLFSFMEHEFLHGRNFVKNK